MITRIVASRWADGQTGGQLGRPADGQAGRRTTGRCVFHISDIQTPAVPFTISEPQNQEIGEFHGVQERRATDFKASKLCKGWSGHT